ncbi:MAG TPA: hypothetical protein VF534_32185 [Paraburkholderia sp.]
MRASPGTRAGLYGRVGRTVITLVRGIVRHRRELVIALDDFHHLSDLRILEALQWLLDFAPSNLYLAYASGI